MCRRSTKSKRNIRIIKEGWWRWIIGFISSFVFKCSQLGLTSGIFLPEHNHCPLTRINCGAEKVELGYRTTLTPIGLERVFQRRTQAVDSPLAAKMSKLPPRVLWRIIQHSKCIFGKKTRRRTAICGEKSFAIADGFP